MELEYFNKRLAKKISIENKIYLAMWRKKIKKTFWKTTRRIRNKKIFHISFRYKLYFVFALLKPQDSFGRFVENLLDLQKVDHSTRKKSKNH